MEREISRESYNTLVSNLEDQNIAQYFKVEKYCGGNVIHGGGIYGIGTNEGYGTLILISNIHGTPSIVIGSNNEEIINSINKTIEYILENGK